MARILGFVLALCLTAGAAGEALAKRVALVIGNSDYRNAPALRNPANDAAAMSAKFESLGFETIEGVDLDYDATREIMRDFARAARDAEIVTIFYAGHGIAVDGVNYIVPVDASLSDPVDWEFQVFAVDEFMRLVRYSSGASLIFLDACRDNPLASVLAAEMGNGTRSIGTRGLARVEVESDGVGMAIAFATSPGEVAQDGEGRNSPFTAALLNHIGAPNADITEIMSRVTGEVYASTGRTQRPWVNASLTGPVVLNRVEGIAMDSADAGLAEDPGGLAASSGFGASVDLQKFMFEAATASNDPADFRAYLDMFPNGVFAQLARNALNRIEAEGTRVAGADPGGSAAPAPSGNLDVTRTLAQPLSLTVTPALRDLFSSESTETALALSRDQRRAVQARLNVAGHDVGGADGAFGPKTRAGIADWQARNGLIATGYLNAPQLQLLTANTELGYRSYLASRPTATTTGSGRATRRTQTDPLGAFIGGVAAGLLLGK